MKNTQKALCTWKKRVKTENESEMHDYFEVVWKLDRFFSKQMFLIY